MLAEYRSWSASTAHPENTRLNDGQRMLVTMSSDESQTLNPTVKRKATISDTSLSLIFLFAPVPLTSELSPLRHASLIKAKIRPIEAGAKSRSRI
jgi:hypothetical protein